MTDVIAERVRKLGGTTLRSIGHISRLQRVLDMLGGTAARILAERFDLALALGPVLEWLEVHPLGRLRAGEAPG